MKYAHSAGSCPCNNRFYSRMVTITGCWLPELSLLHAGLCQPAEQQESWLTPVHMRV